MAEVCGFLGGAHFASHKWPEAVEAYRRGLAIMEKVLPETSPERHPVRRTSGLRLCAGRLPPDSGQETHSLHLEQRQQLALPPDSDYLLLLGDFAQLQQRQNHHEEEKRILFQALEVLVEHVGPSHPSRDEILKAAAVYLAPDLEFQAAYQAMLAADGATMRKTCETNKPLLTMVDAYGSTLLQWAVFASLDRIIDTLIFAGAPLEDDPEKTGDQGSDWPPLQIAIRWDSSTRCERCLQGLQHRFQTPRGWTALHRACQAGDDRSIDPLVCERCLPQRGQQRWRHTTFAGFALRPRPRCGRATAPRADAEALNENTGRSPLHEAANRGLKPVVECLMLNCPGAFRQLDSKGRNAAELAALGGHSELAQFIEKAMKVDKKDREKAEKAREKELLKSKEVTA